MIKAEKNSRLILLKIKNCVQQHVCCHISNIFICFSCNKLNPLCKAIFRQIFNLPKLFKHINRRC